MEHEELTPLTPEQVAERRTRSIVIAAILLAVALLGGVLVLLAYMKVTAEQAKSNRPPILTRLEDDLEAVERSGETVHLRELRGKVLLVGHVYTDCIRGCAPLAEIMRGFQETYRDDPNFQLVSFTVAPQNDPPEKLSAFADSLEIEGENWWFLTGDQERLQKYLVGSFGFTPTREIPEDERLNEKDLWAHDMRLALVDDKGHIRGYYEIMGQHGDIIMEKLGRDLKYLLDEAKKTK